MALKVLFIGGTGQISLPCVELAVRAGHEVSVFNRGRRDAPLPRGVTSITGDMADPAAYRALGRTHWDVVAQFMAYTPQQMANDIATFAGHVGQYVFISSASVYRKSPFAYVITEATPAENPYWRYSQDKLACEALLQSAKDLPSTIVRPSHTVRTGLPTMMGEGDSVARRMLAGQPVLVAGDGNAPWTLTRAEDFAQPFVGLFGNPAALGETFHITGDKGFTWDAIYRTIGRGLGTEPDLAHVATDTLIAYHPAWAGPLLGDKSWTALFDNSKVRRVAGAFTCETDLEAILAEPLRQLRLRLAAGATPPNELDPLVDRIIADQRALGRMTV